MTRMRENDLNRPGEAGNIPGEPGGNWGSISSRWMLDFFPSFLSTTRPLARLRYRQAVVPVVVAWVAKRKCEQEKETLKLQTEQLKEEEKFHLLKNLALSPHEVDEMQKEYVSKLEKDHQTLKQDYKKQKEHVSKLEKDHQTLKQDYKKQKEQIDQMEEEKGKRRGQDICAKEKYLSRVKKQLQERQDIKCSDWNPLKTRSHRELLERHMLGEAETNIHAKGLGVPDGLSEIFKFDNFCATSANERHGYLMWQFWEKWRSDVEREKKRLAKDSR